MLLAGKRGYRAEVASARVRIHETDGSGRSESADIAHDECKAQAEGSTFGGEDHNGRPERREGVKISNVQESVKGRVEVTTTVAST